jgi:hypothetical protein
MSDIEREYQKHMAPLLAEGYILDPPEYERLRLWSIVLFQIHFVSAELDYLTRAKPKLYDQSNFYEHYGRFSAIITAYGRCFAGASGGIVSLDAKDVFKPRPDLRPVHDRMIEIRNGVFAHAGHDELVRATLAVKDLPTQINIKHMVTPVFPYHDFARYSEVVNHVGGAVTTKINKYINHLEKEMGKPIIPDDIR